MEEAGNQDVARAVHRDATAHIDGGSAGGGGEDVSDELLAHVWPTAWEHVNLTGNYSWHSTHRGGPGQLRPLREKLPVAA